MASSALPSSIDSINEDDDGSNVFLLSSVIRKGEEDEDLNSIGFAIF